jgi:putative ABC transport system permease protein
MRDAAGWTRRLVPSPVRERVFDPALADAARERRIRRRRARHSLARAAIEALYVCRALSAALECRAMARAARQPFAIHDVFRARNLMIKQDLLFALRILRKSPGFTLTAVLAIALGIGANTAIFTVVKQVLLQQLPYKDAARIVQLDELMRGRLTAVSPPNFVDWRAQNRTLSALGAYNEQTLTLSGGPEALRLDGVAIDAQVLAALGAQPVLGRVFSDEDTRMGARAVALLGHALWQRLYGGDPGVVGRTITLEGAPYEVVGVMPPGFAFPEQKEIWVPLTLTPRDVSPNQRGAHYLSAVGRLRDGVSVAQARDDLDAIEQAIARQFPTKLAGYSVGVRSLLDAMVEPYQRPLWILFGAVGFVMLIACVNVSNLLLARATTRTGEIAVRSALGAGRRRLIRQLLAESVVLSLAGGAAGMLLGSWGVRALMAVAPADLPRADAVRMDSTVLIFSVVLSIVVGLVFGLAPAVVASRPDLAIFLKDVRRDGGSTGGRRRLRGVLVAAQVALALVLLAGAGLAARSFDRLTRVDPGFRTTSVLTFEIVLPEATYPRMASITQFYRDYVERIQHQPGIVAAGAVSFAPLAWSSFGGSFSLLDRPEAVSEGNAQVRSVTPGYMETLSIPLRAGRFVDARDSEIGPRVALVSEAAARRYWPGANPVGKQIRVHVNESISAPREIVGLVGDVRITGLETEPAPVIYVPHAQYGPETMTIVARTAGDPLEALPALKAILKMVGPGVAISSPHTADDLVAASVAEPRFRTLLLSIFAIVSLALAAVGLYGVVAFSVNQRRAELGLRMALGANRGDVLRLVLREGMMPVAAGILVGLAGAAALASVMKTLLFGVDALDSVTFAAVATVLACVALAACYVPARRAMMVDPAHTLR